MQLSKTDLKELALQLLSYISETISGRTQRGFGSTSDTVILGYEPSDYEKLLEQWEEDERIKAALDVWAVNTAEELLPELTTEQRAVKIGMPLHKYQEIRRNNGGNQEEKT